MPSVKTDIIMNGHQRMQIVRKNNACSGGGKMRFGMVRWFDREKGFGYIAQPSKQDVFVHYSDIVARPGEYRALKEGQWVLFDLVACSRGLKASRVTLVRNYFARKRKS